MTKEKIIELYCEDCPHITLPPNREPMSECDRYCDKYKEDLDFYDGFIKCDRCIIYELYEDIERTKKETAKEIFKRLFDMRDNYMNAETGEYEKAEIRIKADEMIDLAKEYGVEL